MKTNKLSLYNDEKIVIENYNNIKDINDDCIIVDQYYIKGKKLKIKQIEEYFIIIIGEINSLILESDNK